MMELSSKSKSIKKKPKKKKNRISGNVLLPILKPDLTDGICNWTKLQEIMGLEKTENIKTNQHLNDYAKPFNKNTSNKKKPAPSSKKNAALNDFSEGVTEKCPTDKPAAESGQSRLTPIKDKNRQPHKFNFNGSGNNSSQKNSDCEIKRNTHEKNSGNNSSMKNSDYETRRNMYEEKRITKAVAMDCEMVGTGPKGESSMIARVSLVNAYGVCLYDEFVTPKEKVTDYRTSISGVRPTDLKKGKDLFQVQQDVLGIIEGRILVGHSIRHDLDVLFISHPRHLIRDTSMYKPFREVTGGRTPSLRKLTAAILGCEIQSGEHSPVEDAQAAMLLYLRQKQDWERHVKSQRKRKPRVLENRAEN